MKITPRTIVLALTVSVAIPCAGVTLRRDANWKEMHETITAMSLERSQAQDRRDALYGATTEGSAWTQYDVAVEAMRAITDFRDLTLAAILAQSDAEVAARDALLLEAAPVLEYLSRGAHAVDATSLFKATDGYNARIHRLVDLRAISALALASAQADIEAGHPSQAVKTLLDAQQLGRDLLQSPSLIEEMIGCALLAPDMMDPFLAEGGATQLDDETLAFWLQGITQLSDSIPRMGRSFSGELETAGWYFLDKGKESAGKEDLFGDRASFGLRHGFSWKPAAAEYVQQVRTLGDGIAAAYALEPPTAISRIAELTSDFADSDNPIVSICLPKFGSAVRSRERCLARLEFLRHAIALELGQDSPLPCDPFGYGVKVDRKDGQTRVWTETDPHLTVGITLNRQR